ncbi:MAG: 30S ribosomal protein S3 [Candidatus Woesebacteria bacterium GW2011_GWA1_33_30]|uniref:Small ribosomal subunit protein uS3 n=2 Tax=root TaxID=1 RepID=A0A0G0CWD8_9BACT|nr:30S ribosomal protein S3 [uncultured organism]KKP47702.1 MAG: 30S ribosomal protein S3 [Candidatus Woesebacteria bacterium GW2011_GWA2_33_28]KKP48569.1 MAG: 30S ribosomal protein S3 [Candidatus Woesebacteria bacterium GW2011_GWA1_33_30]KKP49708.1 MAG: 30S ribosomal protein S3 [Microgenomates group bacterium GW2011_GWC1_33_32]KKP52325.1 MAG: 30S ribosomal protein S3 [Candidatus Woesebacteria bacterium GW2011_GWB1_33_38]KKP55893.1 MAG: 30S ribosomal protein S3 [Microgenomates group bacterium 
MGQKVNPIGFRTGRTIGWKSRWFSDSASYKDFLIEDIKIRETLFKKLALAGINNIEIERLPKSIVIIVSVSRPGVVIGRGGSGIEDLKKEIVKIIKLNKNSLVASLKIDLKVNEIKSPELSAYLVAGRIASDLERRIPHRRSITKAMDRVMMAGAGGIKVVLGGRINGAEISRVEKFHLGSVPTQTLREDIDYGEIPALTRRGYVGVKVWIHRKES